MEPLQKPSSATGYARLIEVKSARPTIYDVARLAGVSTATVSRALNGTGQIAPATRATIDAAVERLGYHPNTVARSLVTRSMQVDGLVLPADTVARFVRNGLPIVCLEGGAAVL